MSPSAAMLAPLRSVRRSRVEGRNQSAPLTNTPCASPREAQSSGPQCEGGWADARGFTIAFDIVRLLQGQDWAHSSARPSVRSSRKRASHSTDGSCCRKSLPVQQVALGPGRLPPAGEEVNFTAACGRTCGRRRRTAPAVRRRRNDRLSASRSSAECRCRCSPSSAGPAARSPSGTPRRRLAR